MEKLKIWIEAVWEAIQNNIDSPGTIIVGIIVLAGLIIRYCQKLNKKAKRIKRYTKKWK